MNVSLVPITIPILFCILLPGCQKIEGEQVEKQHGEAEPHHAEHKILVTSPLEKDVVSTQKYVCQIHSRNHIEIRAIIEGGYLEEILVKEGQAVKKGDFLFKIMPVLYKVKLDSDIAEANLA